MPFPQQMAPLAASVTRARVALLPSRVAYTTVFLPEVFGFFEGGSGNAPAHWAFSSRIFIYSLVSFLLLLETCVENSPAFVTSASATIQFKFPSDVLSDTLTQNSIERTLRSLPICSIAVKTFRSARRVQ